VSFIRSEQEKARLSALAPYCRGGIHTAVLHRSRFADVWHLVRSLFSDTPFLIARDASSEMVNLVRSLVTNTIQQNQPYDAIHADQLNMAQYALDAQSTISNFQFPTSNFHSPFLVLDEHNAVWTILDRAQRAETVWLKKQMLKLEVRRIKKYEGRVCRVFDTVFAVSENDRAALYQATEGVRKIHLIPIGVDTAPSQSVRHPTDATDILSVGTMFYPPNVDGVLWFAQQVFPLIQRKMPMATFTIIGARPPRAIQLLEKTSTIRVTGYVSDLAPYLNQAACLIVPLRSASGMRVKILEAWARGIPVVSTTIGYEGLDVVPDEHLLVGDTPHDFAQAVLRLLRDPDLRRRLAEAGRQRVEEKYDWRVACKGLDAVYPPPPAVAPSRALARRRVLLLTQVLPYPPNAGPKINVFHKLRHLAEQNAVTLVSYIRSKDELGYLDALSPYCEAIYTVPIHRTLVRDALAYVLSLLCGEPFLITRDNSRAMRDLVNDLVRSHHYALLHVDQINMFQFVGAARGVPRLLDEHNATWTIVERLYRLEPPGLRKLALLLEMHHMQEYEARICRMCDGVLVLSKQDQAALYQVMNDMTLLIEIVPVAWDLLEQKPIPRQMSARGVLSIGTMFYPPNVDGVLWFAKEVWQRVKARVPDATCWIVGARPPAEVIALGKAASGIEVAGYVEDVAPYVQQSALMVVPLRAGGGMRWKILEAFVKGIPVVSTTVGAEGFNVADGRELLLADTAKDFADAVVKLLQDQSFGKELAARARRFAETSHDLRRAYARLDAMYEQLAPLLGDHA
jgi:polysaccharide biosynthesis protein PslH